MWAYAAVPAAVTVVSTIAVWLAARRVTREAVALREELQQLSSVTEAAAGVRAAGAALRDRARAVGAGRRRELPPGP